MRKVVIRSDRFPSAIYDLEKLVRENYKEIFKQHLEDLQESATIIEDRAKELCPVYTGQSSRNGKVYFDPRVVIGALRDSIKVEVSRSNRYPGIRASASAKNIGKSFDYALVQEENTKFSHEVGQAHYLSEPFYEEVKFLLDIYGGNLDLSSIEEYLEE